MTLATQSLSHRIILIILFHAITTTRAFGLIKPVFSESNNNDSISNSNTPSLAESNDPSPTISSETRLPNSFIRSSYFNILQMKKDISDIVESAMPPPLRFVYNQLRKIVLYKPPVSL